jgi:hypothetical protein
MPTRDSEGGALNPESMREEPPGGAESGALLAGRYAFPMVVLAMFVLGVVLLCVGCGSNSPTSDDPTNGYSWSPWQKVTWHERLKTGIEEYQQAIADVTGG